MPVLERVVNTTTQGNQFAPVIEPLADGGWLVIWQDTSQTGDLGSTLSLQRYAADGSPVGPQMQAGLPGGTSAQAPDAAGLADGGWVLTWTEYDFVNFRREVWQQRFDPAGQTLGDAARVPPPGAGTGQFSPRVTALEDGGWVVVWESYWQDGEYVGQYVGLYQQRFDASGAPVGGETQVSVQGTIEIEPAIAALPDGGWVVVWNSWPEGTSDPYGRNRQIFAQRFDADGVAIGPEAQISTFQGPAFGPSYPAVTALADGGWVVAWQTSAQDSGLSSGIAQQRFAADGSRLGPEGQVATTDIFLDQGSPTLVAHEDGGWLVLWQTAANGSGTDIMGRRFLSNGQPLGDDFRLNSYLPEGQFAVDGALLEDGDLVVTWTSQAPATPDGFAGSGHDGDSSGVVQTRFTVTPAYAGTEGADTLTASDRGGIAFGYGGHDRLTGGAGHDSLVAGGGNDTATGGAANDTLDGGEGNDSLSGDSGSDLVSGGNGNDTLGGGDGDDSVWGNGGNDFVWGEGGDDQVAGGDGDDQAAGGDGNDTVWGSAGRDTVWGGDGNDTLYGGGADDTVQGGSHSDLILGEDGNDSLMGEGSSDTIHGGTGSDTIDGGGSADTIFGDAGADSILGGSSGDLIHGGTENDTIRGGTSNDTVYGGSHKDRLYGDSGNDSLYGDGSSDTIYGGDGRDLVDGGSSADRLYGGASSDTIIGGSNNDTLYGGASSDTLTGGTGADVFVFNTGIGTSVDRITDFSVVDDTIHLEDSVFAGLTPGALAAAGFVANTSGEATTAAHRLIYESDSGALWFDADGTGATARVHFATLGAGLALTAADFLVV